MILIASIKRVYYQGSKMKQSENVEGGCKYTDKPVVDSKFFIKSTVFTQNMLFG